MGQQGAGSARTPHGLALPRDCSALEDHLQSESARGRATPDRILADMDPLQRVTREGYLLSTITPPTRRSARHRSGSIGFVRQFWGSVSCCRGRKSFNSVIRFRIYLTPGEFGLPTRYTHPPPTPTPHMGEHGTAEDTACTHSFVTLKQLYVLCDPPSRP